MLARANDVKLMPEIEKPCMSDLGKLCADNAGQDEVAPFSFNLNFELCFIGF